jgi:hypothetical protein
MMLKRAKAIRILLVKESMRISLKAACLCSKSEKTTAAQRGTKICEVATLIVGWETLAVNNQQLALTTNRKA